MKKSFKKSIRKRISKKKRISKGGFLLSKNYKFNEENIIYTITYYRLRFNHYKIEIGSKMYEQNQYDKYLNYLRLRISHNVQSFRLDIQLFVLYYNIFFRLLKYKKHSPFSYLLKKLHKIPLMIKCILDIDISTLYFKIN